MFNKNMHFLNLFLILFFNLIFYFYSTLLGSYNKFMILCMIGCVMNSHILPHFMEHMVLNSRILRVCLFVY